jgi:hypothetical protein
MRSDVILINCKALCCFGRNSIKVWTDFASLQLFNEKLEMVSEQHELTKPIKYL